MYIYISICIYIYTYIVGVGVGVDVGVGVGARESCRVWMGAREGAVSGCPDRCDDHAQVYTKPECPIKSCS